MRRITKRLAAAACIALAAYGAAAAAIALVGFSDHASAADIIVVPGYAAYYATL